MPTNLPERNRREEEEAINRLGKILLGATFFLVISLPIVWILAFTATTAVQSAWGCSP